MKASVRFTLLGFMFSINTILLYKYMNNKTIVVYEEPRKSFRGNVSDRSFHICPLPNLNTYDAEKVKLLFPDPLANCTPTNQELTKLHQGRLTQTREGITCWGRCLNGNSGRGDELGPVYYTSEDHVFECDIVGAYCAENHFWANPFYAALHTQIVEQKTPVNKPVHKQYNVFVIVIDTTGNTQAEKNLANSLTYLRHSMGAVTFPYVNKVGINSRPNAFALMFGKRLEPHDRSIFNQESVSAEWDWHETCNRYLDNETSIFDEFRDAGYKTALVEDLEKGVLNYPTCLGWKEEHVNHCMRPLALARTEYHWKDPLQRLTGMASCKQEFMYELDYMGKFIDSYQDHPKFGWMWDVSVAHENAEGTAPFDKYLLAFLEEHREKLDESFLFILGDHGPRFELVEYTAQAVIDFNNPFLTVSVPEELRKNSDLMNSLTENSRKLQTHWDTRATIIDILKWQPLTNFTSREFRRFEEEKGSSYLRKTPDDRTCATLQLPFEYCICQFEKETLDRQSELAVTIGQLLVDEVNKRVDDSSVAWKCAKWRLREVLNINAFLPRTVDTYHLQIATSPPNYATFEAVLMRRPDGSYLVSGLDRRDKYRNRGKCVEYGLESICDCQHVVFHVFPKTWVRFLDRLL